ncbi:urea ABC transporter ATP-binding subunit UrtE [Puniceicoccus vermicola]|uniref:Urea ABC transporter ATP-binding subunit UrtE n=1 Tax=Puniceicoccus vermicola TaxID=388746 RepID=A0A7X1B1U3_9BACT|nr:urea ABC transporter ATP-binding subunit UrtE [Puniceicoccus vermicola]MBC2604075.1 urea ABC transporter ATP-binding subunit UrtE [Puniceicoccus vermicola]
MKAENNDSPEKLVLETRGLKAYYDQSIIIRGVDLEVPPGKVVSLMGRNGVGKTTTLKAIYGLVDSTEGEVILDGEAIQGFAPEKRARQGLAYVPQGRHIFPTLTVWENLQTAIIVHGDKAREQLDFVYTLFPVIKDMLKRKGGVLSGGQQQQLAIARALLTCPKLLILDEPTEGIQPSIIDQIEDTIKMLRETGRMGILLVEQYLDFAKAVSDRFYVMDRGMTVAQGSIAELSDEIVTSHLQV